MEKCKSGLILMGQCAKRKKPYVREVKDQGFARALRFFDLYLFTVGSMVGLGLYILIGKKAKETGPLLFISFVIAGIAALLSSLCYAELSGRVPGTGSSYEYCYITIGEIMAFIIGWDLLFEMIIASLCRGLSEYMDDAFFHHWISKTSLEYVPINIPHFAQYADFLAVAFVALLSVLLCVGLKHSKWVDNVLVIINLCTLLVFVITALIYINFDNWKIPPSEVPVPEDPNEKRVNPKEHPLTPFGWTELFTSAAICFYGYTGFDCVTTAGEEAKDAEKTIPKALISAIITAMLIYCGVSFLYTLIWPYHDQTSAPFSHIFDGLGIPAVKWIILCGSLAAISASAYGSAFGQVRIFYSMAVDGIVFSYFGKNSKLTKTPVRAAISTGMFTGFLALILDIDALLNMASIGTLMSYSLVALTILILRYEFRPEVDEYVVDNRTPLQVLINRPKIQKPSPRSHIICVILITVTVLAVIGIDVLLALSKDLGHHWGFLCVTVILSILEVIGLTFLFLQPNKPPQTTFKLTMVPFLPALTIFINFYLMCLLDWVTWVRFLAWMLIGMFIYFAYGMWKSKLPRPDRTN